VWDERGNMGTHMGRVYEMGVVGRRDVAGSGGEVIGRRGRGGGMDESDRGNERRERGEWRWWMRERCE